MANVLYPRTKPTLLGAIAAARAAVTLAEQQRALRQADAAIVELRSTTGA